MPVHNEDRTCKKCNHQFNQVVKQGRPYTICPNCRARKETAVTV